MSPAPRGRALSAPAGARVRRAQRRRGLGLPLLLCFWALAAAPARAQEGGRADFRLLGGAFTYETSARVASEGLGIDEEFRETVVAPGIALGAGARLGRNVGIAASIGFHRYETGARYHYRDYPLPGGITGNADLSYDLLIHAFPIGIQLEWIPLPEKIVSPILAAGGGMTWLFVVAEGKARAWIEGVVELDAEGKEVQQWSMPAARALVGLRTAPDRLLQVHLEAGYQWAHSVHEDELEISIEDQVTLPARTRLAIERAGPFATLALALRL